MERLLKKRVRYFLSSRYRGRGEIHFALEKMQQFGPIVVIGGILRELALFDNTRFRSDLDIVIDPEYPGRFRQYVESIGASRNRFGGYVLPFRRWKIDVWMLEDTWAHRIGHAQVDGFGDLVNTTFFNCDAIIYDVSLDTMIMKTGYFEELSKRLLEINLLPNPNPIGNTVRAFRYAMEKEFVWGPKLSTFVDEVLDSTDWQTLVHYEWTSFRSVTIGQLPKVQFKEDLRRHLCNRAGEFFSPIHRKRVRQLDLTL